MFILYNTLRRDRLEPASKVSVVNHRRQRTAFGSDTGRSALATGTGLHAPKQPVAAHAKTPKDGISLSDPPG